MEYQNGDIIYSFAPASVANVGPCYDIMGYCLDYVGDFIECKIKNEKGIRFNEVKGPYSFALKDVPSNENAAYAVADLIWSEHWNPKEHPFGVELTLHKYMPVSSGIGSSAASGVAAGKILYEVLKTKLSEREICEEIMNAEGVTSGTKHPDNVVPSFFGGFWVMLNDCLKNFNVDLPNMVSVIVKPDIGISTEISRKEVRNYLINRYIGNPFPHPDPDGASTEILHLIKEQTSLALKMAFAVKENNIKKIGNILNQNEMLENARGKLIPNFAIVKENAIEAGAYGCTISGSGPSLVSITSNLDNNAIKIKDAMIEGFQSDKKRNCKWLISPINYTGAKIVKSIEEEIRRGEKFHNFYDGIGL